KSTTMNQQQLLRSQSFRHRSRASVMVKRHPFEDSGQQVRERRRSTPNILRHSTLHPSLQIGSLFDTMNKFEITREF
ncbi:unnamed protein product, partial [Onchocerca ochengi]